MKYSILELLKNISPKVYQYRFEEYFVKSAATNYIQGKNSPLNGLMFENDDGAVEDVQSSDEEDNEELNQLS